MRIKPLLVAAAILGMSPFASAQDPDPSKEIRDLIKKYTTESDAFRKKVMALPRDERSAFHKEHSPKPDKTTSALKEIIEATPEAEAVPEAYTWLLMGAGRNNLPEEMVDVLEKHHFDNPKLAEFALMGTYVRDEAVAGFIEKLSAEAKDPKTKAAAAFTIAQKLGRSKKPEDKTRSHELLKAAQTGIGDLEFRGRKIAPMIEGALFEAENLAIGKIAPDIEGDDLHGKPLKLSDYRGKVVVLDFWGDW